MVFTKVWEKIFSACMKMKVTKHLSQKLEKEQKVNWVKVEKETIKIKSEVIELKTK